MPEGRLRQNREGEPRKGTRCSPLHMVILNGSSKPTGISTAADSPVAPQVQQILDASPTPRPLAVPVASPSVAPLIAPVPKKKKGRPRLFLAQVVDRAEDSFVVFIKFNVRNKLARRYFGLSTPSAPPAPPDSLTRLRPPLVRSRVQNFAEDVDESRATRKRVSRLRQCHTRDSAINKITLKPESRLASKAEARKRYKTMLANSRLREAAAERLLESLEKDLPYHGVLPFPDCIINHTDPTASDREKFVEFADQASRMHEDLQTRMLAGPALEDSPSATPMPQGASYYYLRSQIEKLQFRDFLIDTWYSSPYPEEYARNKVLYICEFCLKYMNSAQSYFRHHLKSCNSFKNHPPGVEIYRDSEARISFWEVDGRKNIEYCQSLCLLAKLFLNSKTLYYDVEPFVFYILTEIDEQDSSTYHFVGYFSKEKLNNSDYNVSCILTLPIYQRKGYGSLMIDFSYLLSRREFKYGTPEKPLSDLGLVSYRNYWKVAVASTLKRIHDQFLCEGSRKALLTLDNIAQLTGMKPSDVVFALELLEALVVNKDTGKYAILINLEMLDIVINKWELRNYVKLDPDLLLWKPLIYGPSGGINSAPPLSLIPQAGSEVPVVSNSISMITEFLKDDIGNPYTFEEEAYKSIKTALDTKTPYAGCHFEPNDFNVCHPDFEIPTEKKQLNAYNEIKVADPDDEDEVDLEDDIDVDNELLDSGYEEYLDAESDDGTVDQKISSMVQADGIVSEEEDEVDFYDGESDQERVEDDEEPEVAEDEMDEENSDGEESDDDESVKEAIVQRERYSPRHILPRETRSRRREEVPPPEKNTRRTRRGGF
ncbi:hypothetical protein METBIDRAFT_31214 [Metschnikowia bicuspidata var. bicuspidata NRRL YB-4993]|uniref:Histone acetyltransferase n=1 Tax=Metschnikowia bicuspidata var. bicuspidata NRRL YB-4993 TaxID=869754 RepID=A0A1A0HEG3_9ASCO|nr:hypothetical protein METBIDRAFT_31214 [Metschnikowia bicuspidata var. bicuspidata NRRL YB-4993]OBA22293.1 hypothetical protein METBIDRAFT_31214 [Metschnikowia bicuspidata var. bicuspidata NRRL YB-4993]